MLTAKWATRTHAFRKLDDHLMMHEVTLCGRWFETRDDLARGARPAPGNASRNFYVLRTGNNADAVDCERCQDAIEREEEDAT